MSITPVSPPTHKAFSVSSPWKRLAEQNLFESIFQIIKNLNYGILFIFKFRPDLLKKDKNPTLYFYTKTVGDKKKYVNLKIKFFKMFNYYIELYEVLCRCGMCSSRLQFGNLISILTLFISKTIRVLYLLSFVQYS